MPATKCLLAVLPTRTRSVFIYNLFLFSTWKPPFLYPFLLFEQFTDTPKQWSTEHTKQGWPDNVGHAEWAYNGDNTQNEENKPETCTEIIFSLDDYRMEYADNQKCRKCNDNSCEIHNVIAFRLRRYKKYIYNPMFFQWKCLSLRVSNL